MINVEIRQSQHPADHWFVHGLEARLRGARLVQHDGDAAVFLWPGTDFGPVIAAMREGRHVLVNANSVTSWELFRQLHDAVAPGWGLAILNPGRHQPTRQLIRQHLGDGKLGKPGLIRLHLWSPEFFLSRVPVIDEALWYFGKVPNVVYAHRIGNEHEQIHFGFEGGGMALLTLACTASPESYSALSLIGSTGAAYDNDEMNIQLENRNGHVFAAGMRHRILGFYATVQAFVDAISGQRDLSHTIESWRQVLTVNDAIEQSITLGDAVTLAGGPFHG